MLGILSSLHYIYSLEISNIQGLTIIKQQDQITLPSFQYEIPESFCKQILWLFSKSNPTGIFIHQMELIQIMSFHVKAAVFV